MELKININVSNKVIVLLIAFLLIGIAAADQAVIRDNTLSDFPNGVNASVFRDYNNAIFFIDPANSGQSGNFAGYTNFTGITVSGSDVYFTGISTTNGYALCRTSGGNNKVVVNTGGVDCSGSTEKIKKNIKTVTDEQTSKLMKLRPIEFDYINDGKHTFGMSAEETALIYPELVYTAYEGTGTLVKAIPNTEGTKATGILYSDGTIAEIRGINYNFFTAILLKGFQEQQAKIELLGSEKGVNTNLITDNRILTERVASLEQQMAVLNAAANQPKKAWYEGLI